MALALAAAAHDRCCDEYRQVRSEVEPDLQPVGRAAGLTDSCAARTPAVVEEERRVLVPDVVDEERGAPPSAVQPDAQVACLIRVLDSGRARNDRLDAFQRIDRLADVRVIEARERLRVEPLRRSTDTRCRASPSSPASSGRRAPSLTWNVAGCLARPRPNSAWSPSDTCASFHDNAPSSCHLSLSSRRTRPRRPGFPQWAGSRSQAGRHPACGSSIWTANSSHSM